MRSVWLAPGRGHGTPCSGARDGGGAGLGCGDSARPHSTAKPDQALTEDHAHELWTPHKGGRFDRGRRRHRVARKIASGALLNHASPADARRLLGAEANRRRTRDGLLLGYAVGVFLRSDKTACTEVLEITFHDGRDPAPRLTDVCFPGVRPVEED